MHSKSPFSLKSVVASLAFLTMLALAAFKAEFATSSAAHLVPTPQNYDLSITTQSGRTFSATLAITTEQSPFGGSLTINDNASPLNGITFPLELCQVNERTRQVAFRLDWTARTNISGESQNPLLYLFVGTWNPDSKTFTDGKVLIPADGRVSHTTPPRDLEGRKGSRSQKLHFEPALNVKNSRHLLLDDPIQDADWLGAHPPQ